MMFVSCVMVFISILIIFLLLKLYCKLTVGRCNSKQDMFGKTVLITGASAGIGKATAFDLARRRARVLLACRNLEKAENVKSEIISATGNTNVTVLHLELESFDSVRKCADKILATEDRLDILINNAGISDNEVKMTKDGCERVMQVNHFSHFLLTMLLVDLLKDSEPSRIINVSSIAYILGDLNLNDLEGIKQNYYLRQLGNHYSRSKIANILFTKELAKRLEGSGVTVNAVNPGIARSEIFVSNKQFAASRCIEFLSYIIGKSSKEAAESIIDLAVHPKFEKTSGKFFSDCKERWLFRQANDNKKAKKLFELSEKIVGENYPETWASAG